MFDFTNFFSAVGEELDKRKQAAADAVEEFAAVRVVGEAQELCPVETGALMASGTWSDPVVTGGEIRIVVGFNVSYAAARHERPPEEDAPPKVNPKGGNKFLEKAMRGVAPDFTAYVGERLSGGQA